MWKKIAIFTGAVAFAFGAGVSGARLYQYASAPIKVSLRAAVGDILTSNKKEPEPAAVTLTFAGDVMLDRGVKRSVDKNFAGDYNKLFENAKSLFLSDDITFANFEGTATTKGYKTGSAYSFRMDPTSLLAVKAAGIDTVSYANNHVGDYAISGFSDTMVQLANTGIPFSGAGTNYDSASTPTVIERNGIRVGYLSFTDVGPKWLAATSTKPGILLASDPNFDALIAKAKASCDVLVISVHWGVEYKPHTDRQAELAHRAIDAGADIVAGHHPHVAQDLEKYKNKLIIYSLGNFIFDQYFSPETMQGQVVQIKIQKDGTITNTKEFENHLDKNFAIESINEVLSTNDPARAGKTLTIGWVGDIPPSPTAPIFSDEVRTALKKPDFMAGNLEGAIGSGSSKCSPDSEHCFSFVGNNDFVKELAEAGFDAMNLANNHAQDAGLHSTTTATTVSNNNLLPIPTDGAVAYTKIKDIPAALIAFGTNSWTSSLNDTANVKKKVAALAKKYPLVIVFFHGGAEGENKTHVIKGHETYIGEDRGNTYAFAHAAIDAGADLVLGSGPHVMRGVEKYSDKLIVYSAGNFLTTDGMAHTGALAQSGIFTITIDGNGTFQKLNFDSTTAEIKNLVSLDSDKNSLDSLITLSNEDFNQGLDLNEDGELTFGN